MTVTVREGDRVLYSRKKTKVAPGEMETVTLKADVVRGIAADEITFGLE